MRRIFTTVALMLCIHTAQAQYENTIIKVGMKIPDITLQNPEGKMLTLSNLYKDRLILLDFWASWCGPCRMANPTVVKMYKEYSTKKIKGAKKGFTVVSISLDQVKERWLAAIKQDGLEWPMHLSDLGGWQSKAAEVYGIQFIPQACLVGPDGTVIGWYMMSEQAETDIKKYVKGD
jgi:thiol-disulfide isomerase/thioredoxin